MALKSNNKSLAVVIPMYNEEKVASECVDRVIAQLLKFKNKTILIAVNDGSKDSTLKILEEKLKKYPKKLSIVTYKKNGGYGKALSMGIKEAINQKFDYYLTMDSDLTNPPKCIKDFIDSMSSDADCVKASRYIKGGKMVNVPQFRQIISRTGNFMASLFFNVGIKDCTNGFKMVKLDKLKNIKFKEKNFSIILEEMYYLKKSGAKFIEIPNVLYSRVDSRSHFKYTPKIFYDYFKYLVKAIFV